MVKIDMYYMFILTLESRVETPQISCKMTTTIRLLYNPITNTVVLTNIIAKVTIKMVNATFPLGAK